MKHHSSSYSILIRLRYSDTPGFLGRITSVIGEAEGSIGSVDIVSVENHEIIRDFTIIAYNAEHSRQIVDRILAIPGITVVSVQDRTFLLHKGGKIEVCCKIPLKDSNDLAMAYTPGVARVCKAIEADPDASFSLTIRSNTVTVLSDGSAVLGLGNIGPKAAMPVMEGKCMLFKEFGGVDAFPICLDTQDVDQIVRTCVHLAPTFGGICLEDISSPRCVEIEERLIELLDIPVFHDDQHGTAVVVAAALQNSLKIVGKKPAEVRIVVLGAGAAGAAIAKLLKSIGYEHIVVCDRSGIIGCGRSFADNPVKRWLAENTNADSISGDLSAAVRGADIFIGVSSEGLLTQEHVKSMNKSPIVFALANPVPEILPEQASPCAAIMATGRSDYPNQINNVLCFPGLFRGMLDVRAKRVTPAMKIAAVQAIAVAVSEDQLRPDFVIPSVFDRSIAPSVARAVAKAAVNTSRQTASIHTKDSP